MQKAQGGGSRSEASPWQKTGYPGEKKKKKQLKAGGVAQE
jgi:hypothetical protein